MAEIVNLRRARKARTRADAEQQAAANRLAFGRTMQERQGEQADADRLARTLDGARREP